MYYVYILRSNKLGKLYIGVTSDLRRRFKEHNCGGSSYTKMGVPWELMYYEAHTTSRLARKAELFYKTGQGRRQVKKKLGL